MSENEMSEQCEDGLDEFMIPKKTKRRKITPKKHPVFKFYRKLVTPIQLERKGKLKSLLCSICLKDLQGTNCDDNTWKKYLSVDTENTSNLAKHLKTQHHDNPDVQAFLEPKIKKKRKQYEANLSQCISSSIVKSHRSSNLTGFFPKMDSMENLRDRIAKWLYLDGRPFHMIESPNFKAMMVPLVKDYTTMSRDTFNERIDFEIKHSCLDINKPKPNLTTIADPWYFWKGICVSKAHKPVSLSGNPTFRKV